MTDTTKPETGVRELVRQHYAEIARTSSSCCGSDSSCCGPSTLYDANTILEIPDEISNFSLGCGDPVTFAGIQAGETVLDLGSGGGLDCFLAAKKVGPTGYVIGVDMTPEMIVKARSAANRMGIPNVEFREGYLEALPVDDNTVDLVISNCVINLSPDKPQVFREIFRVLKPDGRISLSDTVTRGVIAEELRRNMDAWSSCVSGSLDIDIYIQELEKTGFEQATIVPKGAHNPELERALGTSVFSAIITAVKPV
jgi:SAM-dependent methyltransferase